MSRPEKYADQTWDVIVIGTGIGGGVAGRRLAEAGLSVLFLERGPKGERRDQVPLKDQIADPVARQVRGFWPVPAKLTVNGISSATFMAIGAGLGGSSVFYAGALERPERHDLDHSADRPHPTFGWVAGYEEFRPYFAQSQRMFHVSGTPDPLSDDAGDAVASPPDQNPGDQRLSGQFQAGGLHPYQTHTALKYLPGCQHCFGHKCPRACKMDGRSAGVEPALETGNAVLLADCDVTRLVGDADGVRYVEAQVSGAIQQFRARRYIVAGGALGSARLLLASKSDAWPKGCANSSGLVGRNLMFHLNEMIAVWPQRGQGFTGASRTIALRDFYYRDGQRFGMLQAMGVAVGYGEIVHYLNLLFDRSILRHLPRLRVFAHIPAALAARLFGQAKIFVGILEDLPYASNRLTLDPDNPGGFAIEYNFAPELLARRKAFRRLIRRGLRGLRSRLMGLEPMLNLGHPCGTAVFGADPETSVLDVTCKAHDLDNLYVVDGSFMPTSMGVNPSLTIAANALRVADIIAAEMAAGTKEKTDG